MADHSFLTDQGYTVVETGSNWPETDIDEHTVYFRDSDNRYAVAERDTVNYGGTLALIPLPKDKYGKTFSPADLRHLLAPRRILATSPSLPVTTLAAGTAMDHAAWSITAEGTAAGVGVDSTNVEKLTFSPHAPDRWIGVMLESYVVFSSGNTTQGNLFVPWGGFAGIAHAETTVGSNTLVTRNGAGATTLYKVQVRTQASAASAKSIKLDLWGSGTIQAANTHIRVHAVAI